MAENTVPGAGKDEPRTLADLANPLFDLAALLRLAHEAAVSLEDSTPGASDSFNALQRTIAVCMRDADRLALVALDAQVSHG